MSDHDLGSTPWRQSSCAARRPPSRRSCAVAPPRVNSARLAAVKYRCSTYDASMPVPPCTWTAVCATRWPASAAQNLAVATAAADLGVVRRAGGEQPGGLPHREPDRLDVDVGVGEALGHRLERPDRPPELLAAARVLARSAPAPARPRRPAWRTVRRCPAPPASPPRPRAGPARRAPGCRPRGHRRARGARRPPLRAVHAVRQLLRRDADPVIRRLDEEHQHLAGTVGPVMPGRPAVTVAGTSRRSARGRAGTAVFTPDSRHPPALPPIARRASTATPDRRCPPPPARR